MAKSKETVTRISIDHQPFLDLLKKFKKLKRQYGVSEAVAMLTRSDVTTLLDHGEWFRKFVEQRKRASAARSSHGPRRKPDSEVSPNALAMRKWRDARRDK
jgi:hypothetical protein